MGNGASGGSWPSCYGDIRVNHDEAYRTIQEAITLEEQERPQEVINSV